jgi:FtsP/CotA-like multicopper oxidase with cupredoxin domain
MSLSRRNLLSGAALLGGAALLRRARADEIPPVPAPGTMPPKAEGYTPVVTPNVGTLPWTKAADGAKVFHLVAEPVKREFAKGMIVDTWGYNGSCPGPTIEVVEGDRVRIFVTNKLPERTSVHWHGVILPNGMDGVSGLNQPHIEVGETYVYEFVIKGSGIKMYHPHSDEMVQMAMGMMGFFVIHPKKPVKVDRHFCILLHEWSIPPGTSKPNPAVMLDFNIFTFNGRVWPGTDPLVVKEGDRVRISLGNLSMDNHPIHLHGHVFELAGTDGGEVPKSARWPETTVDVPTGSTRTVEFVADNPGDWAFHCHKSHHTMNAMSHDLPNMLGVNQKGVAGKVQKVLPSYMPMGQNGMGQMMDMGTPKNTLPMMSGKGPYGDVEMGGMFTILKVRKGITSYDDPGWYKQPEGTTAKKVGTPKK